MDFQNHKQNHKFWNSKVYNIKLRRNMLKWITFTWKFHKKNPLIFVQIVYKYMIFFALVAQKTACFQTLLCSSTEIYCKNIVTILLRLPAIYRKHVFAISSHIYQTVSQDYLLLHKISVPQSFAKHGYPNITRISAKASAASHVTNWQQKSIWFFLL